jgi:hypothetical protein
MTRLGWRRGASGLVALATAGGCRDVGVNPCDRPFPDVDRSIDVAAVGAAAGSAPLARLRVVQRYTPGIDDGCAEAVTIRLSFVGVGAAPVSFSYRVTWSTGSDGWSREGTVTRLVPGVDADAGTVPGAARLGDGALVVSVTGGM